MKKHHIETLISREDIQSRVKELAQEINRHYQQFEHCQNLVVVGLLRGSFYVYGRFSSLSRLTC